MVLASSALIAILLDEQERPQFTAAIAAAERRLVSSVTKFESSMIMIARRGSAAPLDALLRRIAAVGVPFDDHQADIARDAFARYGKGRHPAGLNFGDCASYALAISEAEPLLFKGTDFGATDVEVAIPTDLP
jgi:ribonuclease VapC